MRRVAMALLVACGSAVALGDDNAPKGDAREVILKAIDAQGGKTVLDKYVAAVAKISGHTTSTGTVTSFTGAMASAVPGRFRIEMNCRIMGRNMAVAQAVIDDRVTQTVNGRKVEPDEFTKTLMIQTQKMQDVTMLTPLVETDRYKLTRVADELIGDIEAAVVKVEAEGLPVMKLLFDKKSGFLVKVEYQTTTPQGNPVLEATTFEDYRPISGTMVSMRQITTHDGKLYTSMTSDEIKLFEKLDDTWFTLR